jgi:hypothetical protein
VGKYNDVATRENSVEVPYNLKIKLLCNPEISLLDISPEELKMGSGGNRCTPMFTATLLTTAKRYYSDFKKVILLMSLRTLCNVKYTSHRKTNTAWLFVGSKVVKLLKSIWFFRG